MKRYSYPRGRQSRHSAGGLAGATALTGGRPAGRWFGPLAGVVIAMIVSVLISGRLDPETTDSPEPAPYASALTMEGDIASELVGGVDRFLLRQTEASVVRRERFWRRDFSSREAYDRSVSTNRQRLAHILGVRDRRPAVPEMESCAPIPRSSETRLAHPEVAEVRWRAFGQVHGEGLLITPLGRPVVADVIAIPDADCTPEQLAGLAEGVPPGSQFARALALRGCRVLVPALVSRRLSPRPAPGRERGVTLTDREYIHRPAYELGRHILGYEIQKVLAAADWFVQGREGVTNRTGAGAPPGNLSTGLEGAGRRPLGVVGWGEGGLIALCAGALDPRIDAVAVSGYFESRQDTWKEPVDRNVFGLLEQFGDAELASLIAPRPLTIEASRGPEVVIPPGQGGAPGRLRTPMLARVEAEVARARELARGFASPPRIDLVVSGDGSGPCFQEDALRSLLEGLAVPAESSGPEDRPLASGPLADGESRRLRQLTELDRHNQELLAASAYARQRYFQALDTSSVSRYLRTVEPYRAAFSEEIVGRCHESLLPVNPRGRLLYDRPKWRGYEIVMDVYPDVISYGILLLPKDLAPGERRPAVVCQHGLDGRPKDTIEGDHRAYHDFSARLAEQGFIVFAPQNLYLFEDRFRTLQRKANPLKLSLFSIITAQHEQILNWLGTLPNVDPERIGFYGLSYGGKTAMRVPALLPGYCLSICSADFNDWVWKNASTISPYSYVWTGEYEIFEWDLGSTFNYAEMAALIAPRPFMVERGHFDGVAPDEAVAYEFAKVRHLYAARLGLADRCAIEWFPGPHTIHGQGTFEFLRRHLRWPPPAPER